MLFASIIGFLDESYGFYMSCSQDFSNFSTIGTGGKCEIGFNYKNSQRGVVESHDGFIPEFAIAEIKDPDIAAAIQKIMDASSPP